jgi:hypothetical protein
MIENTYEGVISVSPENFNSILIEALEHIIPFTEYILQEEVHIKFEKKIELQEFAGSVEEALKDLNVFNECIQKGHTALLGNRTIQVLVIALSIYVDDLQFLRKNSKLYFDELFGDNKLKELEDLLTELKPLREEQYLIYICSLQLWTKFSGVTTFEEHNKLMLVQR